MEYIKIAIVLLFVSLIIMPAVIKLNILDVPNERKIHNKPVPKAGGLGIFIPFLAGMIWFEFFHTKEITYQNITFIIITTMFVIIGVIDDKYELKARHKLILQMLFTCISMASGLMFRRFGWFNIPVTFLWYIGIINGINLIDGLDGLAGGLAVISSLGFGFIGLLLGYPEIFIFSSFLIAGCLGFLTYNFHPAKIFMGDTGSLPLGYILASMGILVSNADKGINSLLLPGFILAVPIYDTLLSMVRRKINGKPIFAPDRSHFYNLLMDVHGVGHRSTVIIIYAINVIFTVVSLLFLYTGISFKILMIMFAGTMIIILSVKFRFVATSKKHVIHSQQEAYKDAIVFIKSGM